MAEEKKPSEGATKPAETMAEIVEDLEKEKKEGEGKLPEGEKKPEEEPKKEPPKEEIPPEGTPKKEKEPEKEGVEVVEELEEEEKEKEPRPFKFVPLPKFLQAKDKWKEREADLLKQIEEAKKGKGPETPPAEMADLEKEVAALAEETGADPEFSLKLARIVVKHTQAGQKIPQETIDRIVALEELQKDKFEATAFEEEFRKGVEPLLETEGIAKDRWAKIKKVMETLAFTEEYAKMPLKQIWRLEEFDELRIKGKKSAEGSGAGIRGGEAGEEKPVTEMSDKEFDEWYGKNVEADKGKTTVITRGGKKVK